MSKPLCLLLLLPSLVFAQGVQPGPGRGPRSTPAIWNGFPVITRIPGGIASTGNPIWTGTQAWCFSVTAKPTTTWANYGEFFSAGAVVGAANSVLMWTDGVGAVGFRVYDAAGGTKTMVCGDDATGVAHTFVGCSNRGALTFHRDGVACASAGGAGTGIVTTMPATLHQRSWVGAISGVRACRGSALPGRCR